MTAVSPMGPAGPAAPQSAPADDAFEALYEQYSDRVFGYCLKWLRCREEAEDAVQTTFLYAMRGLRRGIVPKFDEAWLLAIARNVCLTRTALTRRRAVEVTRDPQLLAESVAAPARSDDLADLSEALIGLTEAQRRAILLREWQGLSYQEIAAELDLSQAAVETLLFRARRALAARLRGAGSFLPWLKSFAGGGAGSLAVGATIVAVTAAGTIAAGGSDRPGLEPAPAGRPAVPFLFQTEGHPRATPVPRRHASARAHAPARASEPAAAGATPGVVGSGVEPAPGTTPPPIPTQAGVPKPVSDTQTVAATTQAVADTAGDAAQAVVAGAADAAGGVESIASNAVAATTDTVAGAGAAASASAPALSTVTVGGVVPSLPLTP